MHPPTRCILSSIPPLLVLLFCEMYWHLLRPDNIHLALGGERRNQTWALWVRSSSWQLKSAQRYILFGLCCIFLKINYLSKIQDSADFTQKSAFFWLLLKNLETLAALLSLHDNNQLEVRSSCPSNGAPASSLTTGPIKPLLIFFILMASVGNGVWTPALDQCWPIEIKTCHTHNLKFSSSHLFKWKGAGEINFNNIFYLIQYIHNTISTHKQHKKLVIRYYTSFSLS